MDARSKQVLGLILLIAGGLLLAVQVLELTIGWNFVWPVLAFMVPGLAFHLAWGARPGRWPFLVPGGILLTYGVLFLYEEAVRYADMGRLWPIFIAGPGVGLLEAALFGGERHLLFPAAILLTVTAVALGLILGWSSLFIGVALILLGAAMLVRRL